MYKEKFSNIISVMNNNNIYCQGASQQMANGFYRIFEALEIISSDLDEKNANKSKVSALRKILDNNNALCQGAPQQCANGVYRIAEILEIIISMLDKKGEYAVKTKEILRIMDSNNALCQGASQQTANGSYRVVELLEIITKLVAPAKNSAVTKCVSEMNRINNLCQGAPQQSANGTDAAFYIVQHIVSALDTKKKYKSELDTLETLKIRNNALCQGADQQSANNIYRIMETIEILGKIFDDEAKERIANYWKEHKEEHDKLLSDKAEYQKQINDIKKEANGIKVSPEAKTLEKQAKELVSEMNAIGVEELNALKNNIAQLKNERSQLGFFKFALRKEADLKIEEAESNLRAQEQVFNVQKAEVQKKIDAINAKIEKFKAVAQKEKQEILKGCAPFEKKIAAIDLELNKKR